MRGNELLDSMSLVHPAYIEAADAPPASRKSRGWVKWGGIAACLCLVAAAALPRLLSDRGPASFAPAGHPAQSLPAGAGHTAAGEASTTQEPQLSWTAHYNEAETVLDASRLYIPGYFTEALSEQEIAALLPPTDAPWLDCSGRAGFDGEGTLVDVSLSLTTSIPDTPISVAISAGPALRDYGLTGEPVVSTCQNVEYTLYQWSANDSVRLDAEAEINGYRFLFTLDTTPKLLERARGEFEQVLTRFATYGEGAPDLSAVTAEAIPVFFDLTMTLSEAKEDPDFGGYLQRPPGGFAEESIRRYKDQNSDYLAGLWTRGYDSLRWEARAFTQADAARLTSTADRENYDLSLYPIPRAESVPDELWEIVDNPIFDAGELTLETVYARAYQVEDAGDTGGWRMAFSVKYGGIVVEVRAKGVEPEWVYQQLTALLEQ